jgi:glycerol-3-phosphate dehydrogenase subunit B
VLGSLEQTRWLADLRGAVRAADLAFTGAGEGDLVSGDEIALVDVPGLAGYDARAALRALAGELGALELTRRPLRLLRLELPPALADLGGTPARLARALEAASAREALRPALERLGGEGRILLFPPVLGLERVAPLLTWISDTTGCRCAELLGAPPLPLAGYRLDRALCAALGRAGVAMLAGCAVSVESQAGRAVRLRVDPASGDAAADSSLALDALVLATGRFVGGGIGEREGRLAETLLDLPLYDLAGKRVDGMTPGRLARRDYEGEQPLFAAGVRTDARLRPLGPEGDVRLANVFAAGDLLGSFDPARERSGLGVALLSGRRAGIEASRC